MKTKVRKFRDGLFNLNTRRFGIVAENMIQILFNISKNNNKFTNKHGDRIEIAFSRALKRNDNSISENIIESCSNYNLDNRLIKYKNRYSEQFSCNFQQLKRDDFDYLYYGIFFKDIILIFIIESKSIGKDIRFSNKQHKNGHDEGQFIIDNSNIETHENNHLSIKMTYKELFDLFSTDKCEERIYV
jgi:hypothetical protein